MIDFLLIALGVLGLYVGGEFLVRNASRLAKAKGMSPLVVGLTVVAFGTSSPELATTLTAAVEGSPGAALGNVVGSNSANLGLVLGLAALLYPLGTSVRFLRQEVPFMIGTGVLLVALLANGTLGRAAGLFLVLLLGAYLWALLRGGTAEAEEPEEPEQADDGDSNPIGVSLAGVALGVVLLVAGAYALVEGALDLARAFEVPERVIGLTLVAVGGSLPELGGTLVAALRRQGDIVLGNLVGSNVFNVLFVLGITALVRPLSVSPGAFTLDLLVMLALSLMALPLLLTGRRLGRREGALLLGVYLAYVGFLYA
ncbi:MAG TPA: calcium/sodium antiporter [Rubrobacter sp.]|nr:calcium/sodium antiporter [Rubrobacter sp.]